MQRNPYIGAIDNSNYAIQKKALSSSANLLNIWNTVIIRIKKSIQLLENIKNINPKYNLLLFSDKHFTYGEKK